MGFSGCVIVCLFCFPGYNVQRTVGNSGTLSGFCLQEETTISTVALHDIIIIPSDFIIDKFSFLSFHSSNYEHFTGLMVVLMN